MHIDTFLFDLDGTLVDSVTDLSTAVNMLRREISLPPLDTARVRTFVGDGATLLVKRSLPDNLFREEYLLRFLALYGEHLLERTVAYPGIRDFLDAKSCIGARMAVVTNKPYRLSMALLDGLDLLRYFSVVVGGDTLPQKKPDPAPVIAALEQLGAPPGRAVLIGDHHTDLAAGRAAGVRTCFCAWGIGRSGGLQSDFSAETPDDLQHLFPAGIP